LTQQQFITLDLLRWQKRAAISGCAGSGKTFIALEQAQRLARRGFSVLLTCYNRYLANWLRQHLMELAREDIALRNIEVMNFHRVAYRLCERVHIPLPQDESRDYDEDFAVGLITASDLVEDRYDAILADEGQDFNDSWWDALLSLLRSPEESLFYVFYDDNQRIYGRHSAYPIPSDHYYPLTINCRTTLTIHEEVMKHYNALDIPTCKGPQGRAVEHIPTVATKVAEQKALFELLKRLTQDEGIAIEDIVLLSPVGKNRSHYRAGTMLGRQFQLSWDMERPLVPHGLMCCTIFAFKGLERDVVIFAEPDKIQSSTEREQLIYVALSRARFHLIILGNLS
jgi:UvrD-like helicase C-terminal domain/AAA domain